MNKGLTLAELLIVAGLFTVLVILCAIPEFIVARTVPVLREMDNRPLLLSECGRSFHLV